MFLRNIALTFMISGLAIAQVTTSTSTTRSSDIGPVGVGSTETIQVTVANLAANSASGTAASCTGSISFNNSAGTAIGTATNFTLTSGQISSVSLPFNRVASSGVRAEVIAVISQTTTTSSTTRVPCELRYAVETFDTATGASHVYISGSGVGGGAGFPGR
jgi:hypothetical protein